MERAPEDSQKNLFDDSEWKFEGFQRTTPEMHEFPPTNPLTIANWNLKRVLPSQPRFLRMQTECSKIYSDIWVLTETHGEFVPQSNYFGIHSQTPDRESQPGEKWSSIWTRWPITSLEEYVTDKSRCVAGLIENSPFGKLVVYGTVLPWSNDPRGESKTSLENYKENLLQQKEDWNRLRKDFPHLLIVAGDFNQSLAPVHYYGSHEKRHLLESVLIESGLEPVTYMKADPVYRDSPPYACIDHICIVHGSWETISTTRWPDVPDLKKADSDHFGVQVVIA